MCIDRLVATMENKVKDFARKHNECDTEMGKRVYDDAVYLAVLPKLPKQYRPQILNLYERLKQE